MPRFGWPGFARGMTGKAGTVCNNAQKCALPIPSVHCSGWLVHGGLNSVVVCGVCICRGSTGNVNEIYLFINRNTSIVNRYQC